MQTCPGCKLESPSLNGPVHRYMESSPACWATYGKILAREYSSPDYMAVHRLTVDAYAVQHPGRPSRQSVQSVAVHLISLFMVLERKLSHQEATAVIGRSVEELDFTWLEPPPNKGELTVENVIQAKTAEQHCYLVEQWAGEVWTAWSPHRAQVERWIACLDAS
ncbi:MAG: DUF5946 family protein [Gammaproteobacteria bacterium]